MVDIVGYCRFVYRNPSYITNNARDSWFVQKAMDTFRKANTFCAWCGRTEKLEVHHIQPVSVAPHLAADESNMIMLCRKPACHQVIGHDGDFGGSYVDNVRQICEGKTIVKIVIPTDTA